MEDYLRFGLLSLAAVILVLILVESWLRRRRFKLAQISMHNLNPAPARRTEPVAQGCTFILPPTEKPAPVLVTKHDETPNPANDLLVLSVFAKPNTHFASYELLQSIFATGMQFGEMNIFHYYLDSDQGRITLFSLASATKPGDFNLDRMGEFSCMGLTLFMDLRKTPQPESAFNRMLEVAEQLADDLDGDLYAGPRRPWNADMLKQYREQIAQYKSL